MTNKKLNFYIASQLLEQFMFDAVVSPIFVKQQGRSIDKDQNEERDSAVASVIRLII